MQKSTEGPRRIMRVLLYTTSPMFKPSGTGAPPVCSLKAVKPKFYCQPPDF